MEICSGSTVDTVQITVMALPVEWDKRKDQPGFGTDGWLFPSVRLLTRSGALLKVNKPTGMGCRVHCTETTEEDADPDMIQIRKAWRKWMARAQSYNWVWKPQRWAEMLAKAKGEEGALAALMTAKMPKYRWPNAADDDEDDSEEEEDKGKKTSPGLTIFLHNIRASPAGWRKREVRSSGKLEADE